MLQAHLVGGLSLAPCDFFIFFCFLLSPHFLQLMRSWLTALAGGSPECTAFVSCNIAALNYCQPGFFVVGFPSYDVHGSVCLCYSFIYGHNLSAVNTLLPSFPKPFNSSKVKAWNSHSYSVRLLQAEQ